MKRLILLRPYESAQQSATVARDKGFDPLIAPVSDIKRVPWNAPPASNFDAIMITSANALRYGGEEIQQYKQLPLFAVGRATAKLAQDMGFTLAAIGKGGAKALWPLINQSNAMRILRLVGRDYVPISDKRITTIMTYESCALPINTTLERLMRAHNDPAAMAHIFAFHSARAVQILDDYIIQMANKGFIFDKSAHFAAALAPAIGEAIRHSNGQQWRKIIVSSSANDAVMIEEISEVLGA